MSVYFCKSTHTTKTKEKHNSIKLIGLLQTVTSGPRSGKTGLNDNNFEFHLSTFSITGICYDQYANIIMSLRSLCRIAVHIYY